LGVESSNIDEGCRECFEIGKANLASHLRRAIGADVEAFASPEERVLEAMPNSVRGAVSMVKEEEPTPSGERFRRGEVKQTMRVPRR
jgi:hypothetical protein